jgi:hypothetical protein
MLRLAVHAVPPLRLRLGYRAFVHDRHASFDVVCRSRGELIAEWHCAASSGVADLLLSASAAGGLVELEFEITDPRSSAADPCSAWVWNGSH